MTLDYDTDGAYWAFYINGEYAMTGVDATSIEAGASYTLKAEKARGLRLDLQKKRCGLAAAPFFVVN